MMKTSCVVTFNDCVCQACQGSPIFGSRLKRNNKPKMQSFVLSPTSANRGLILNYSSNLPQDCDFRQPVWNFLVSINELNLLTVPIVPQRKVTLPEIIFLKKLVSLSHPLYAFKNLSISVALWSSCLLAGQDDA